MSEKLQKVEAVGVVTLEVEYSTSPSNFTFRPERGWVTLQQLCFWFLTWIRAYKEKTVTRFPLDAPTFGQRLYEQQKYLFKYMDRQVDYLLVGCEDYALMMAEETRNHTFVFDMTVSETTLYGRTYRGVRVRVVPWMQGFLVVPKERD